MRRARRVRRTTGKRAAVLALVDKYENWMVIIFSLQLPTLFRVGLRTTVLGTYGSTHYSLCVGVPVVFLELAYALNLLRQIRAMQGLRIAVNDEFASLDALLESLPNILAPGGRAVFLTFHSGEDRRVKKALKAGVASGVYSDANRRPVRASPEERRANARSGCCKLRWFSLVGGAS